jgi:serine/threonine protein kinase
MYAPPERADLSLQHGRARDVWAFGCVLLEVLVLIARGWTTDNPPHACSLMANHLTVEMYGLPCWVDVFKEARRQSLPDIESRSFAGNMSCVEAWRYQLSRESPDPMFSKLLYAVGAMMTRNPTDRLTSVNILNFVELKNWQEVYKELLVGFHVPQDSSTPITIKTTREALGPYTTEALALMPRIDLQLIEGYLKVDVLSKEDLEALS